jgi:hypothetical protein
VRGLKKYLRGAMLEWCKRNCEEPTKPAQEEFAFLWNIRGEWDDKSAPVEKRYIEDLGAVLDLFVEPDAAQEKGATGYFHVECDNARHTHRVMKIEMPRAHSSLRNAMNVFIERHHRSLRCLKHIVVLEEKVMAVYIPAGGDFEALLRRSSDATGIDETH